MNIGTIVTSGVKGQIVIPLKIREELGINPDTPLEVKRTGSSITIYPVTGLVRKSDEEVSVASIIASTRGSWGTESASANNQAEKSRSNRLKKSW